MNLMIFVSPGIQTASHMADALKGIQQQEKALRDAAISIRHADGSNRMSTCPELVGNGQLGGMFWGVLFALIYWSRFWGLNIGSIVNDYGIDDEFIREISRGMTKEHSTLALLAADEALDTITRALDAFDTQIFTFALSRPTEDKLNAIFASKL